MSRLIAGDWRSIAFPDGGALTARFQEAWIEALPPGVHSENANIHPKAVFAMPLACYPRTLLCEVETVRDPEYLSIAAFLYGPFGVRLIDGNSTMIHDLNFLEGILLETPEQAAAYGRFFCSAVHGEQGRFEVIEAETQLGSSRIAATSLQRIGAMTAHPNGDRWQLSGVVRYADALFAATFGLDREGLLVMEDEQPLEALEGHRAERFEAPFRLIAFPASEDCEAA